MATTVTAAAAGITPPVTTTAVEEPLITCSPFAVGYIHYASTVDIPLALDAAPLMLQLKQLARPEDALDDLMWPIDASSIAIVRKIYNLIRAR